jgi:hypothetical protein
MCFLCGIGLMSGISGARYYRNSGFHASLPCAKGRQAGFDSAGTSRRPAGCASRVGAQSGQVKRFFP